MKFSQDFFQDEYRSNFHVPQMMKRAWAAKLELLQIIINICHKHNLTYFADYGTLLGAIRHQGFIPWDDDIDIALKRSDYNTLLQIISEELPHGIALAGLYSKSDAQFLPTCQSLVVTISSEWNLSAYMERFHGFPYRNMGIDIFPLDFVPLNPEVIKLQKYLIQKIVLCVRDWSQYDAATQEEQLKELESLCNVKIARDSHILRNLMQLQDSIRTLYTEPECNHIVNNAFWFRPNSSPMPKEWFNEIITVPFENIMIDIPRCYHEILTSRYDDYMTPVMFTSAHTYPFYASEEKALRNYLDSHGYTGSIDDFVKEHYSE